MLSIIVPLYNTEKFISRCITSLLKQTIKEIEIIIVNDCSTDDSLSIAQDLAKTDNRIRIISHEKNMGLFHARITGVEAANGEFIGFVDSDDYVSEDYFRVLYENAHYNNSDIVVGKTVHENESGRRYVHNLYDSYDFGVLTDQDVLKNFWEQEGYCFIWHTVWNKIYRKTIWEKALPILKEQTKHLIMTEDFVFSAILFNYAKKLTSVEYGCYFYYQHGGASTSNNGSLLKFQKNISDLINAFSFVEKVISNENYKLNVHENFLRWKNLYCYFWINNIKYSSCNKIDKSSLKKLLINGLNCDGSNVKNTNYFYAVTSDYNNRYNEIITKICDKKIKALSLDIFDTAILRPYYKPVDLFKNMDCLYSDYTKDYRVSFTELRIKAEKIARRKNYYKEDISLDEIYDVFKEITNVDDSLISRLKNTEINAEIECSLPRKSVLNLYKVAIACGKEVYFTTDMYLDNMTITKLLNKNGYNEFESILISNEENAGKGTGRLFDVLIKKCRFEPSEILHIGDNWDSDIINARKKGINAIFYPKTIDCIQYNIQDIKTTHSCCHYSESSKNIINFEKTLSFFGSRTALAIAANKLYDNPFLTYNEWSEMNCSPEFFGYYALGMYLLGFTKWLCDNAVDNNYDVLAFVARDGYLPMKAYEIFKKYKKNLPDYEYFYTSRKATLPAALDTKADFYSLYENINPYKCTLSNFISLLSPILKDNPTKLFEKDDLNKSVGELDNFKKIIDVIFENVDKNKSENFNEHLKTYAESKLCGKAAFVDIGYSGRTQEIFSKLCKHSLDAFYVHINDSIVHDRERNYRIKIRSYYDFSPSMSGAQREWIFSEYSPSCIGYEASVNGINPVFEKFNDNFVCKQLTQRVHNSALEFINDFCECNEKLLSIMDMRNFDISYPCEFFLNTLPDVDSKMFDCCIFEDDMWAGNEFSLTQAWRKDILYFGYASLPLFDSHNKGISYENNPEEIYFRLGMLNKSKFKRALYWMAVDTNTFKQKLKGNLIRIVKGGNKQ